MSASNAGFECCICLDTAAEPVVTRCGHLYCWPCLDNWLCSRNGGPVCPTCNGRVDVSLPGDVIPLYGKGKRPEDDASPATAPAAEAAAAAAEGEQQQRNTSYHFSYTGRDASEAGHPRPAAARAAPPPPQHRPPGGYAAHGGMPWGGLNGGGIAAGNAGLPLSLGTSFVFLGANTTLTIIICVLWAAYYFVPWQGLSHSLTERCARAQRNGLQAFFATPPTPPQQQGGNDGGGAAADGHANANPAPAPRPQPPQAQLPPQLAPDVFVKYCVAGVAGSLLLANLLIVV